MKNSRPRKPTRREKIVISNNGLIPSNWLVIDDPELESYLKVKNKTSGKIKILDIYKKRSASTPTKAKKHSKSSN